MKFLLLTILLLALMLPQSYGGVESIRQDMFLSKNLQNSQGEDFQEILKGFRENTLERIMLLNYVLYLAQGYWKVDNKAYLYALAIDLYNSLPPDQAPGGKNGLKFNEENDISYKKQFYDDLSKSLEKARTKSQVTEKRWKHISKEHVYDEETMAMIETTYIEYYLANTVVLDRPDDSASLNPERINVSNPTYYSGLVDFLQKNKKNIQMKVIPWEAYN